ncbi:sorting nexin-19 isoform X2 [Rhinatrema bivittatum]|uniref:sorting nexin-19 isoform X2 n=1 Tax=Rhinatrema bivittatum TaxID=194408 RepID=UPI0011276DED|nr:sorting nexin-19 isoform X2 [Rhinatrema bivittatum]
MFTLNNSVTSILSVFGEVTGSKLLAIGVVLGWLVVVHVLVNIWLLFLLCVLLMALGLWLGVNIVVNTSNQVHLERFATLESLPQSMNAERHLEKEINSIIQKVIRDFVLTWYRLLSSEPHFEDEVRGIMNCMAIELKKRIQLVNRNTLTEKVLVLAGYHLQSYMKAKETVADLHSSDLPIDPIMQVEQLWKGYSELFPPHLAIQSSAMELTYTRGIANLLLSVLVPKPHLETRTGKCVIVELIACNVLLPVINRMSDPDWINLILIDIFSKSAFTVEEKNKEPVEIPLLQPPVPSSLPLKVQMEVTPDIVLHTPTAFDVSSYDVVDSFEYDHQEDEEETAHPHEHFDDPAVRNPKSTHHLHPDTQSPLFFSYYSEPESPVSDLGKDMDPLLDVTTEELLTDYFQDSLTEFPLTQDEEGDEVGDMISESTSTSGFPSSTPITIPSSVPEILRDQMDLKEDTNLSAANPVYLADPENISPRTPSFFEKEPLPLESFSQCQLEPAPSVSMLSSSPTSSMKAFIFQPLNSPDGPVVIQNLRITGTVTAREHSGSGSHPYTLYTVKYETALDDIKGPKKLFPDLPFGNMDSEKVEARKSLLDSFLKQLCAIPEIASSEEVQEFLALNTDARIAFVKKPFPRLDKMVVNAIVDTLKTAFPKSEPPSPTEELSEAEIDGKPQADGKKTTKSRLRFPSSKIAPALSASEMQQKIRYCLSARSTDSEKLPIAGMESFVEAQEKLLAIPSREFPEEENGMKTHEGDLASSSTMDEQQQQHVDSDVNRGSETAQADAALDILWLVMKDRWSWLCTENMQRAIHLLFGTLIQRWLEVQVVNLTCTQRCVIYLRLLQQAIWPGGKLRTVPRPARSQEQKQAAREEALQSLMRILPDFVQEIFGVSKCWESWELVLESLQNPSINRHLVYCIWDIMLGILMQEELEKTTAGSPEDAIGKERWSYNIQ